MMAEGELEQKIGTLLQMHEEAFGHQMESTRCAHNCAGF